MQPVVQWQTASPLWHAARQDVATSVRFKQPALLRFASDTFMEDLMAQLARLDDPSQPDPDSLAQLVARYETWKEPRVGWLPETAPANQQRAPRLYQPVHGRFYLITASLVCRIPGLPDKTVDTANDERVSFVLRRLVAATAQTEVDPVNPATYVEFGWVAAASGQRWQQISPEDSVDTQIGTAEAKEERLPLFSLTFRQQGRQRRMLAGLVPVTSHETYQAAPQLNPIATAEFDPRLVQFEAGTGEGIKRLRDALTKSPNAVSREQAQAVLLFAMLDFVEFLDEHLDDVRQAALFEALQSPIFYVADTDSVTWRAALNATWNNRAAILDGAISNLGFIISSLPGQTTSDVQNRIRAAIDNLVILTAVMTSDGAFSHYDLNENFRNLMQGALGDLTPDTPGVDLPDVPKLDPGAGTYYVLRCVYERPHCWGVWPAVVSAPSRPFQLAPFFDPEAPMRPVRITMPVDTTIEGLRKFPKNVSFLISKQLRQQMERIDGIRLGDLDDGNIPTGNGVNLGMICSLSIPIITICALILLMIIVQLLNIVFWWLPFFKICLPLNLQAD